MRSSLGIVVLALAASTAMMGQQPDGQPQKQAAPIQSVAAPPTGDSGVVANKIGGDVSAPVVISSIDPDYSDYARRYKISGICLLSMIVDAKGGPQNVQVVKSLEQSLDENAIAALYQYRFKPAIKDGQPVPVQIKIEIRFKLRRSWFW